MSTASKHWVLRKKYLKFYSSDGIRELFRPMGMSSMYSWPAQNHFHELICLSMSVTLVLSRISYLQVLEWRLRRWPDKLVKTTICMSPMYVSYVQQLTTCGWHDDDDGWIYYKTVYFALFVTLRSFFIRLLHSHELCLPVVRAWLGFAYLYATHKIFTHTTARRSIHLGHDFFITSRLKY